MRQLEVAAEYLARLQSDDATLEDERAALAWRSCSQENQQAWDTMAYMWDRTGSMANEAEIAPMIASLDDHAPPRFALKSRQWIPWAIAASLVAILGSSIFWLSFDERETPAATMAARDGEQPLAQHYAAQGEARRRMRLPDGSTIILDAGSEISVAFSDHLRDIRLLHGRAFFTVSKDKARPFVVHAGDIRAIAVGTAFDVGLMPSAKTVTTVEGLVRVETQVKREDGGTSTYVPAGMKLTQSARTVTLTQTDTSRDILWTQGQLAFDARCLADVAQEMNRYSRKKLVVTADAANIAISGMFTTGNVDDLADALAQQGLVTIVYDKKGDVVTRAAARSGQARCQS